jgi:predicted PurR-regulated permease PerM
VLVPVAPVTTLPSLQCQPDGPSSRTPAAPPPEPPQQEPRVLHVTGPVSRERRDTIDPVSGPVVPIVGVRFQRIALIVVVLLAFVAAAWVASELLGGLLLGVLTAFAVEPLHRRLLRTMPRRRALVSAITVIGIALILLGCIVGVSYLLGTEAVSAVAFLRDLSSHPLSPRATRTLGSVGITPEMLSQQALKLSDRAAELASTAVSGVLGSAFHWFAGTFIAMITAFYTLRDRQPIERRLAQILPLHPRTTRELVEEFRLVGRGTLVGSVLAGLTQGVLATVGYAIAGVPRALLLGVLTAAASLVPVLGTLLIWVPVGALLIVTGRPAAGVFSLVWGVLITTSLVDYVLRPIIAGRECRSHPLLFLIGLIGGVEVFGGVGIVAGPIVMTFFASALRIYRREVVDPARLHGHG